MGLKDKSFISAVFTFDQLLGIDHRLDEPMRLTTIASADYSIVPLAITNILYFPASDELMHNFFLHTKPF